MNSNISICLRLFESTSFALGCLIILGLTSFFYRFLTLPSLFAGFCIAFGFICRDIFCLNDRKHVDGEIFVGSDVSSGREIWLSQKDISGNFKIIGPNDESQSEILLGYAANALSLGGGFIYIDVHGNEKPFLDTAYELCRKFGREDDLHVLNFTGKPISTSDNPSAWAKNRALSMRMDPFNHMEADDCVRVLISLLDNRRVDSPLWMGRGTAMLTGFMRALCWLRDKGEIILTADVIRSRIGLASYVELTVPHKYPDMPPNIRNMMVSYLNSLPGFIEAKGGRQSQTTIDQHGYLELQFCQILSFIADSYGHILSTNGNDIDLEDIIRNRRILVVSLPLLRGTKSDAFDVGRIILANHLIALVKSCSHLIHGDQSNEGHISHRPPFFCLFDNFDKYSVLSISGMSASKISSGNSIFYGFQKSSDPNLSKQFERYGVAFNGQIAISNDVGISKPQKGRVSLQIGEKTYLIKPFTPILRNDTKQKFVMNQTCCLEKEENAS